MTLLWRTSSNGRHLEDPRTLPLHPRMFHSRWRSCLTTSFCRFLVNLSFTSMGEISWPSINLWPLTIILLLTVLWTQHPADLWLFQIYSHLWSCHHYWPPPTPYSPSHRAHYCDHWDDHDGNLKDTSFFLSFDAQSYGFHKLAVSWRYYIHGMKVRQPSDKSWPIL